MKDIQILFVDGPTAVGKDYFIGNFKQAYAKRFAHAKVTEVRAADIVLKGSAKSEERKYTTYETPLELAKTIYKGHIDLLDYLRMQSDLLSADDLIIVNRSFLSYHVYNYMPLQNSFAYEAPKWSTETLKGYGISDYAVAYKKRMQGLFTGFVELRLKGMPFDEKVDLLVNRVSKRADRKLIDKTWFEYLVNEYEMPKAEFIGMFDAIGTFESDEHKLLLDCYFK